MKAKKVNISPEIIRSYDKLIANYPGLERKGANMPYTSLNGHMFSFLDAKGNLNLRLPEKERDNFINQFKTILSVQHGSRHEGICTCTSGAFEKNQFYKKIFRSELQLCEITKTQKVIEILGIDFEDS